MTVPCWKQELIPYTDKNGIERMLTPGVIGYQWEAASREVLARIKARREARASMTMHDQVLAIVGAARDHGESQGMSTPTGLRERCELTDLIRAECGHCRAPAAGATPTPSSWTSSASTPGSRGPAAGSELDGLDFGDSGDDAGPVFTAQHYSTCPECGEKVKPGHEARMVDGAAVHEDCA